ncbi:MAG: alternative ribosome rescue aminoacyl-tRNA hydrolase ArfB [Anaerolineales bacterium]
MDRIQITPTLALDLDELEFHFVRSPGPGGQKVNKVATTAQLRFDVAHSPSLPNSLRNRLLELAGRRATAAGILILEARRFRSQERNRADAVARLVRLVRLAAQPPKVRRATQPRASAKRLRLEEKRKRGEVKRLRRSRAGPEE